MSGLGRRRTPIVSSGLASFTHTLSIGACSEWTLATATFESSQGQLGHQRHHPTSLHLRRFKHSLAVILGVGWDVQKNYSLSSCDPKDKIYVERPVRKFFQTVRDSRAFHRWVGGGLEVGQSEKVRGWTGHTTHTLSQLGLEGRVRGGPPQSCVLGCLSC